MGAGEFDGLPPQPDTAIAPANRTMLRQAVNHAPCAVSFFLTQSKGSRRKGRSVNPAAAPGKVSVNTTVTWYVPFGVVEDVAIDTVLVAEE